MTEPTWRAVFERYGMQAQTQGGILSDDPFTRMAALVHQQQELPPAQVSLLLSTASEDYAKQRLSVTITCPCPNTEACISFTTEAVFILARRLINQGAAAAGLPLLE